MARSLSTFAATALFTLLALSSTAFADSPSDDDVEARLLYQAGVSAYDAGRFEEALERFQRAYELSGREMLLYNIATAAERARQDEIALDAYERFLEAEPETKLRGRVEAVIARLRREIAQAESARETQISKQDIDQNTETQSDEATPPVPLDEPVAASSSSRGPGGLITLAAGGAVLVAGAVTLGMGLADRARVQNPSEDALDWQRDAARAYDRGPALLTTGIIALPIGAALTAVGVVMAIKSGKHAGDDPEAARADLSFGPGSIMLKGRF